MWIFGLGISLLLGNCSSPQEPNSGRIPPVPPIKATARTPTGAVQVGDSLELFVMEDTAFNGTFKVREKGDIIVPKIGRVQVAGLGPEAIQDRVKGLLEANQLKQATVIVDRVGSGGITNFAEAPKVLIFVTGSVNRPGQHMIAVEGGDTVYAYEAVLIAGGTNQFADERKAYVLRRSNQGARQKIPLDLRAIRQGSGRDVALAAGDMICVPSRRFSL